MNEILSASVMIGVIIAVGALMFFGKRDYFTAFTDGAKSGLTAAAKLLPALCAIMVALRMFAASGAVEILTSVLAPMGNAIGVPAELFPLLLTRPVSGAASNAAFAELMESTGADSFPALCAAVIMGSSDTLVYVTAVYFSATSAKRTRHTVPTAIAAMIFTIFTACLICRLFFT